MLSSLISDNFQAPYGEEDSASRESGEYPRSFSRSRSLMVLLPAVLFLLAGAGCRKDMLKKFKHTYQRQIYQNYEGFKFDKDVAVLEYRGYRFWLKDTEKLSKEGRMVSEKYDVLRLTPGDYLIGFRRIHPREGGAAFCRLKADRIYSFEITSRQYLPRTGTWGYKGKCLFDPERKENQYRLKMGKEEQKKGTGEKTEKKEEPEKGKMKNIR